MSLSDQLQQIIEQTGSVGGILILHKSEDRGQHVIVNGLDTDQVNECLCVGIYYNVERVWKDQSPPPITTFEN